MKIKLQKIIVIMFVLIISLVFTGCTGPDPVPSGGDGKIPSKSIAEIEANLGSNYEISAKYSGSESNDGTSIGEFIFNVKKDKNHILYSEYPSGKESDMAKYILNKDKLYIYLNDQDKYMHYPLLNSSELDSLLAGYNFVFTYSTLKDYPCDKITDVKIAGFDCKQYEFDGVFQGSAVKFKVAINEKNGLCFMFDSVASTDFGTFASKYEITKFELGKVNIDDEIAKIDQGSGTDVKIDKFVGKSKQEIESSLSDNFLLQLEIKEDNMTGNCTMQKDKGYTSYQYSNNYGYNDIILIKDDYYLSRGINSQLYLFVYKYDELDKATDVSDIQSAYNLLVKNSSNIDYLEKETVKYLDRDCTKLHYEAPRPYAFSSYLINDYIIDNQTGLCLYYKNQSGSSADDLDVLESKVIKIEFEKANLDTEIEKIVCEKWLEESVFNKGSISFVSAPIGTFVSCDIEKSLSGNTSYYDFLYEVSSIDEFKKICNAFYGAGLCYNKDEEEVKLDDLFASDDKDHFVAYNKSGTYVTIDLDETNRANVFDLSIIISFTENYTHKHTWGKVSYVWSDDYKTCTATRICEKEPTHIETETVDTKFQVFQNQSCEKEELSSVTAVFTNSGLGFDRLNDVVTKPATGHIFDQEKSNSKFLKDKATCEAPAVYYKSCVCGKVGTDTFTSGDALGHDYSDVSWVWSSDNLTCKIKFSCYHDETHFIEKDAVVTVKNVEASCAYPGFIRYTAKYVDEEIVYEDQIEIEIPVDETKHNWDKIYKQEPTCTDTGMEEGKYCFICGTEILGDEIPALGHEFSDKFTEYDDEHHAKHCTRDCGEVILEHHTGNNTIDFDDMTHYYNCTVCNAKYEMNSHEFDESGYCDCGAIIPYKCTHNYVLNETNSDGHFKKCNKCGSLDYETVVPHNYELEIINDECLVEFANCSHPTIYAKTCECGAFDIFSAYTFMVGELGDHFYYLFECADNHKHIGTCYICDEEILVDCEIDTNFFYDIDNHYNCCKLCSNKYNIEPHTFNEEGYCECGIVDPSKCDHYYALDGFDQTSHFMRCSFCHTIDEESRVEHSMITIDRVEPTCFENGYEEETRCDFCGYFIGGKIIKKIDHDFSGDYLPYSEHEHRKECKYNCGELLIEQHSLKDEYEISEWDHHRVCEICHEIADHNSHEFLEDGKCICGAIESYNCDHSFTKLDMGSL